MQLHNALQQSSLCKKLPHFHCGVLSNTKDLEYELIIFINWFTSFHHNKGKSKKSAMYICWRVVIVNMHVNEIREHGFDFHCHAHPLNGMKYRTSYI